MLINQSINHDIYSVLSVERTMMVKHFWKFSERLQQMSGNFRTDNNVDVRALPVAASSLEQSATPRHVVSTYLLTNVMCLLRRW